MKVVYNIAAFAALAAISTPALAGPKLAVQPVQIGNETVRYEQGIPTLDLEMNDGVVQVTPLPLDHGGLSFSIAVYNDGRSPSNIGIENITVLNGDAELKVFSKDELVKKAETRAMWTQIGLAALGAAAAYGAASQRNHYRSTFVTPRGTYRSYFSAPSAAGQIQATAIAAGTGYGIAAVQNQLDQTRQALGAETVQLTTVDPGDSYAGRIVVAKLKAKGLPQQIKLRIMWNGEEYPFAFQVAKPGTKAPLFTAITKPSNLTDFRPAEVPASAVANAVQPVAAIESAPVTPPEKPRIERTNDPAAQVPLPTSPI
jgi:hypothetical protein